jgi:ABC-2 type transport system ATP-binding protein
VTEGVSKRYGRSTWALRDVTIRIGHGEIVAVFGPNGAGKSTLIKSWAGFERPTRGSLEVSGFSIARHKRRGLNHVAYVAQGSPLLLPLTARDHGTLARSLRSAFDERSFVDRLDRLDIPAGIPVKRLSGGQRAQVALGLALASPAAILLLDEPLSSLDPLARRTFMAEALASCRQLAKTLVVSSHVVSDVDPSGTRLILLDHGQVRLDAWTGTLLATHFVAPADRASHLAVGSIPRQDGSHDVLIATNADTSYARASLEDIVIGYLAPAS